VTAAIRVHHLKRADLRPEQFDRDVQVRGRISNLHDLKQRAISKLELLPGSIDFQPVLRHPVQQGRRLVRRQAGNQQFGLVVHG